MRATPRTAMLCLLLAGVVGWHSTALAQESDWIAVDNAELERQRGGFDGGTGLLVAFGVERAVSVNGDVVRSTSFHIPDVARMNAEQARLAAAALSTVDLIQVGPNNHFQPDLMGGSGLVIQNSLNDQLIRSQTVINASVNSMALLNAVNVQTALSEALANALGPK